MGPTSILLPIRLRHPLDHMLLHRQALLLIALTPIQRLERAIQIPIEEKHHAVPLRRILMHHPMQTALVPIARPLAQHIPHVDHIRVRIRRDGHPTASRRVIHLQSRVPIRQQQRDGSKVRVRTGAELRLAGLAFGRRRVVQQAQGCRGRVGHKVVEDVRAEWQGTSEHGDHGES